ncbi:MAG: hypothetical protein QY322_00185 [bacterium]|nr:MAG: hypothetical protein QY322_00185 [bacterium]
MHAFLLKNIDPIDFANKQKAEIVPFTLQKIEDAKNLKKLIKFSFNIKTAIVIENIDNATNEALNAFLKNLEEPNDNLIYVLTAKNLYNVLPTITSRCQIIKTVNPKLTVSTSSGINSFEKLNLHQKFEVIGKIKGREEAVSFVEDLVLHEHDVKNFKNLENYLSVLKNLKLNGNVGLQLTNLVVRMNSNG